MTTHIKSIQSSIMTPLNLEQKTTIFSCKPKTISPKTDFVYINEEEKIKNILLQFDYNFHENIKAYNDNQYIRIAVDFDNVDRTKNINHYENIITEIFHGHITDPFIFKSYSRTELSTGHFNVRIYVTNYKILKYELIAVLKQNKAKYSFIDTQIYNGTLRLPWTPKSYAADVYCTKPNIDIVESATFDLLIGLTSHIKNTINLGLHTSSSSYKLPIISTTTSSSCAKSTYINIAQYISKLYFNNIPISAININRNTLQPNTYSCNNFKSGRLMCFCKQHEISNQGFSILLHHQTAIIYAYNTDNKCRRTQVILPDDVFATSSHFGRQQQTKIIDHNDKTTIDKITLNGNLNILHQPAGSCKTTHLINLVCDTNTTGFITIISPLIRNINDIKSKIIDNDKSIINILNSTYDKYIKQKYINNQELNNYYKDKTYYYINALSNTHLRNFNIIDEATGKLRCKKLIIISSVDSYHKIMRMSDTIANYNILIIDEFAQVMARMAQLELKDYDSNYYTSKHLLSAVDRCNTAFVSEIIANDNVKLITTKKQITNIILPTTELKQSYETINISNDINKLAQILTSNKPLFIWFTNKTDELKIYNYLIANNIAAADIAIINADTEFDKILLHCKYILTSPSIQSCISIGTDDCVFDDRESVLIYTGSHITELSAMNAVQRVRKCKTLHIFKNDVMPTYSPIFKSVLEHVSIYNIINSSYKAMSILDVIESLNKTDNFKLNLDIDNTRKLMISSIKKSPTIKYKLPVLKEPIYILQKRVNDISNATVADIATHIVDVNFTEAKLANLQIHKQQDVAEIYNLTKEIKNNIVCDKSPASANNIVVPERYKHTFNLVTNCDKVCVPNVVEKIVTLQNNREEAKLINHLNKIKNTLDEKNIKYNDYTYNDEKTYGVIHKDRIVPCNFKNYCKLSMFADDIKTKYESSTTKGKFKILADIALRKYHTSGSTFGSTSQKLLACSSMYKKYINMIEVNNKVDDITNFKYFDIDEYAQTLKDTNPLKKRIHERRDRQKISRRLLKELVEAGVDLDCINYYQTFDEHNNKIFVERDINNFNIDYKIETTCEKPTTPDYFD